MDRTQRVVPVLLPVLDEVTYVCDDDVLGGWNTFTRGVRSTWTVTLRPEG